VTAAVGLGALMLSYDELKANELHVRLQRVLGRSVQRLHGVKGMRRAYRLAAMSCDAHFHGMDLGDDRRLQLEVHALRIVDAVPAVPGVDPLVDR
jgi:hypothetical protein